MINYSNTEAWVPGKWYTLTGSIGKNLADCLMEPPARNPGLELVDTAGTASTPYHSCSHIGCTVDVEYRDGAVWRKCRRCMNCSTSWKLHDLPTDYGGQTAY